MKKILVSGGAGYIGSHTIVDLLSRGYEVICADNFSRSTPHSLEGISQITGRQIIRYTVDLCDAAATALLFQDHPDLSGIIHFAAFKAVGESVEEPLRYYRNNLGSLMTLLHFTEKYKIPHFIFSSSCTVYGEPDHCPLDEQAPLKTAQSPYGATKQMCERILQDVSARTGMKTILLRYFNPAGAHPSGLLGELPLGKPQNLVPAITQFAIGKIKGFEVHGTDYPTRDGSCIRDYIHIMDLARAHTLALEYLEKNRNGESCEIFNLGSGQGTTVLEAIHAFEQASGRPLPYQAGPRRPGDVIAAYADYSRAKKLLGWEPRFSLLQIMEDAWRWEKNLVKNV